MPSLPYFCNETDIVSSKIQAHEHVLLLLKTNLYGLHHTVFYSALVGSVHDSLPTDVTFVY